MSVMKKPRMASTHVPCTTAVVRGKQRAQHRVTTCRHDTCSRPPPAPPPAPAPPLTAPAAAAEPAGLLAGPAARIIGVPEAIRNCDGGGGGGGGGLWGCPPGRPPPPPPACHTPWNSRDSGAIAWQQALRPRPSRRFLETACFDAGRRTRQPQIQNSRSRMPQESQTRHTRIGTQCASTRWRKRRSGLISTNSALGSFQASSRGYLTQTAP
jgi:hypothetical protein